MENGVEDMIDWFENFVKTGQYNSAAGILVKMDEIIRMHSVGEDNHPCHKALLENEEEFRQKIGDFIMLIVNQNLDACTVGEGCEEYGKVGTIPKWKGQPGISHIVHEVRPREKKDLGLIDRDGHE